MQNIKSAFSKEYMHKLNALTLRVNNKANTSYQGLRKSGDKGNSLEFSDFKNYTAGDDLTKLDWNAYARTDKLYVKIFEEEKQANINIFLDTSLSMDYGDKGFYAKMLAASIAYTALSNMDAVNLFTIEPTSFEKQYSVSSKNLFMNILNHLDDIMYTGETNLSQALSQKTNLKRGTSFVISDFFSDQGYASGLVSLQYNKQDLVILHVLADSEMNPSLMGSLRLIDNETLRFRDIQFSESIIAQYKNSLTQFRNEIAEFCGKRNFKYVFMSTSEPILKKLPSILA